MEFSESESSKRSVEFRSIGEKDDELLLLLFEFEFFESGGLPPPPPLLAVEILFVHAAVALVVDFKLMCEK